jgi:hypothetical protein
LLIFQYDKFVYISGVSFTDSQIKSLTHHIQFGGDEGIFICDN